MGDWSIGNGWYYTWKSDPFSYDTDGNPDPGREPHYAVDYFVPEGTPIRAVADGYAMVDYQVAGGVGYGWMVILRHDETDASGNHFYSLYAHLAANTFGNLPVLSGERTLFDDQDHASTWRRVKRGQIIAKSGISGTVWPHLHFAVFSKPACVEDHPDTCGRGYRHTCHPEKSTCDMKYTFDPYDLCMLADRNTTSRGAALRSGAEAEAGDVEFETDSSAYYPPNACARHTYAGSTKQRCSGVYEVGSGDNRLWITDPPRPAPYIEPPEDISTGEISIAGSGFGETAGIIHVYYAEDSANSEPDAELSYEVHLAPHLVSWSDDEIVLNIFQGQSGDPHGEFDSESLAAPLLIRLYRADDSQMPIAEIAYPFNDIFDRERKWYRGRGEEGAVSKPWYVGYLMEAWKARLINGFGTGNVGFFLPNTHITRAEVLKMAVTGAGFCNTDQALIECEGDMVNDPFTIFTDLPIVHTDKGPEAHWSYGYVRKAYLEGWLESDEESGLFRPDEKALRREASEWLFKAADLSPTTALCSFLDVDQNDDSATIIHSIASHCIAHGSRAVGETGFRFRPTDRLTRAEAATMVVRTFVERESCDLEGDDLPCRPATEAEAE